MRLTHLSLFSGIGGFDIAAEKAGFETVGQVELDGFCTRVLEKHWPDVPRFGDIRTVSARSLREAGIERPTLITGGFPCQPFSTAGYKRGSADHRHLWPEMLRVVQECRPTWVVGENVFGFVSMALEDVCADLERLHYAVRAFLVPAVAVGAPHLRERCFIVAHAGVEGGRNAEVASGTGARIGTQAEPARAEQPDRSGRVQARASTMADAEHGGGPLCRAAGRDGRFGEPLPWDGDREDVPGPFLSGVANGIPHRAHRIRALGNAVVPEQVYPILKGIADAERGVIA